MKIGIVTQPLANNYGGLLQNFALQKVLKEMGHDVKTIDFVLKRLTFKGIYFYLLSTIKSSLLYIIPGKRRPFVKYNVGTRRLEKTKVFIDHYIELTKQVTSYKTKIVRDNSFDAIIVGSDQVWRDCYNTELENMFLSFVPDDVRKIVYAASFGVGDWKLSSKLTDRCARLAKRLNHISVREESGVNLCSKYLGVNAEWVLDPTMLVSVDIFRRLISGIPVEGDYLFSYVLDMTDEKEIMIDKIAGEKGLDVKKYSANKDAVLSVEEWISMIANASFVITDSFHGSVFSILFHREFRTVVNEERGADRFVSLLSLLGLESRILSISNIDVALESIDWNKVDNLLEKKKKFSYSYLSEALCLK